MKNTKKETIGLLVIMEAKPGKAQAVKDFLLSGLDLVNQEPETVSWFAFQIDKNTFGIFDTFKTEAGKQAHLKGEVAKALLANADHLLENFDVNENIQPTNIIATNHKIGAQRKGLVVMLEAKARQSENVERFLKVGKALVSNEPQTVSWYAIKLDNTRYAIFDTFADHSGRDAHLTGKVAAALMENAPLILKDFNTNAIQTIDILASK